MYPTPNERLPLVDTDAFKQQGTAHPSFGMPINGFDLFHGTKKDAVPSIMQNGFDDHFFNPAGYFGAGAYFADDPVYVFYRRIAQPHVCVSCDLRQHRPNSLGGPPTTNPAIQLSGATTGPLTVLTPSRAASRTSQPSPIVFP